ncbi:MAG: polysaccharide biosynthesis C-terminal domain-containing protein [Saprospirales bacterium]|nr:polysaccharide biosynthesis C-terminal domain-containing protein [Saprospirales bacterium]MBK8490513.1 polysaccharide biosynthesis C-terminal domain-containing protein [Saprospirales bacterium]
MGIIIRQSVRQSIVQYIGISIGLLSTLFIYPLALSELGLLRFIINTAQLVTPFCLLGTPVLAVRFFPIFRDEATRHHGFLSLLQLIALAGVLVFALLYFAFSRQFAALFADQPAEYLPFLPYAVPLVFFMVFGFLYTSFASNFHKVLYPAIFNELLVKIGVPVLVLFFFLKWIDLGAMMNGMLLVFLAVMLAQAFYLVSLGQFSFRLPDPGFITRPLQKELFQFGSVNILSNWAYMLSNRIDIFMLGLLLGPGAFKGVGIYSILYIISEVIDTPRKAVMNISSPIIAEAWKKNDLAHLNELYEKSTLNQFLAGLFLFIGIWAGLDGLFVLMPNGAEIAGFRWVVFFLGLSKVSEMLTGVNSLIIQHSRYFRFNFYSVLLLAVINILNNLWLIPKYGMLGAAIATFISVVLFNLAKFLFLRIKLGMNPFTLGTLAILLTGLLAIGLGYLVPIPATNPWLALVGLIVRSAVITGVYLGIILYFRISPDLNGLVNRFIKRILKK